MAEYYTGGQEVGRHDFYIGVGRLSQWSVDVAIGIDLGTTNTAVGYFRGMRFGPIGISSLDLGVSDA